MSDEKFQFSSNDERLDTAEKLWKENQALARENAELKAALSGMLDNYIELKVISLAMARSDAPNWIGSTMTPEDDIHVVRARAAMKGQQ